METVVHQSAQFNLISAAYTIETASQQVNADIKV